MKYRTHTCGQLTAADTGAKVVLSGWVETIRDHGGVLFVDLRDHYGVTQIVVHDDAMLREVSKETVIMVAGEVSLRDEETVNPKLATGHVEVVADKIDILGKCMEMLPFEIQNTANVRGKLKRMGRSEGMTSAYKKAIVQLTEDSKAIEYFNSLS